MTSKQLVVIVLISEASRISLNIDLALKYKYYLAVQASQKYVINKLKLALDVDLEFWLALFEELLRPITIRILEIPVISFLATGNFKPSKKLFLVIIKNTIILCLLGKLFLYFCQISPLLNEGYEFVEKFKNKE